MDKMRKEFEDWFYSEIDGNSDSFGVLEHLCWQAWQASRAALVVDLPATCNRCLILENPWSKDEMYEHDEYFEVDDIKNALEKAGVCYE